MQKSLPLALLFLSTSAMMSKAAVVWVVGIDDTQWNFQAANPGTGGGANATFVAETGGINPLPGTPTSPETDRISDNDYYFQGLYNTAIASNTAFYGPYAPVGLVAANEESVERAFAAADLDLRYHFNLPTTLGPNDTLSLTFDAFNLDTGGGTDPRFGVELYINSVKVMDQVIIRPGQIDQNYTSTPVTLASVNAQTGPGADNIVSLRGISYNGDNGGNWMGVDFIQLDSQVVPEPTSGLMLFFGAVGLGSFLRRKRA